MPFQNYGYGGICQGLYALVLFCKLYELAPMHLNVLNLIFHYFFSQLRLRVLQPSSVGPPISSTSQNRIWNVLYEGVVLNQEYCGFSSVLLIYTITCLVVDIFFTVVYQKSKGFQSFSQGQSPDFFCTSSMHHISSNLNLFLVEVQIDKYDSTMRCLKNKYSTFF